MGSKPEIYPVYWSPAQMQARQSERMATVQAFLNAQWRHDSGCVLLRPLLPDVPDDEMCGVTTNQNFPVSERWHPLLMEALSGIPDVRAGDSVWWHCDMVHSVAPVTDQQGWGNVMYIPAAPWCPRNEGYAASVRDAFLSGASPSDFPAEDYEREWPDRFALEDLTAVGRAGLGLDPQPPTPVPEGPRPHPTSLVAVSAG